MGSNTVWSSKGGKRPMNAAELAELANVLSEAVDDYREQRREEFREAARAGIKGVLGTSKEGEALLIHQQNLATHAQQLQRKESKGTATAAEIAELDTLDAARDTIQAWRDAENAASVALDSAGTDDQDTPENRRAEIDLVAPTWPS